ncbi:hypothetical protein IGI57_002570 [Enterococcus sp. DIV0213j]|uniref:DUF1064 domain-containing protein n=1 Tax=Enterococcus sp. DIV0213j TaxID=2774649 RepID=UPI003D28ED04
MFKQNKYKNKKTSHRGILFDSKAEAEYYDLAIWQAEASGWTLKLQEKFEIQPKFELNGKKYQRIDYKPDFVFYDKTGKIVKVVDVKGVQTRDFKLKAKIFCYRYQIPLILAKKRGNVFEETAF